jgi:4-hydroxy-tetrahydrodipicolinate synthase
MAQPLTFSGIMPANLLPFRADFSIHEPDYRRHLTWLAGTQGVTGIVCNGHAAEVASLTREERRRALAIAVDEVGGRVPLVAGVYADGSLEAADLARDAKAEGARGLLVFPPSLFMWGVQVHPDMAWAHYARIADAVDLPLVAFQYPVASGIGYTPETLVRLTEIPTVVGVKEWSNDIVAFERNLRAIRATGRPVAILSSFTMSLLATFLLGADGAISGFGSVIADLQAELFAHARGGDVESGRKLNDRIDALVRAVYAPPFVDMHNRMKEMLVLLGRLDGPAVVRPPLVRISDAERTRLRALLREAGVAGTRSAR